jgi:hypothetical protein
MSGEPARRIDRFLLGCLRLLPTRLARHLLFLLRSHPALADRWGYHIRAIHYYEPLPDFREVTAERTRRRRDLAHLRVDMDSQVALVRRLAEAWRGELDALARGGAFDFANEYFAGLDACLYYALVRELKPRRIVEVGAGHSTRIAGLALARNGAEERAGELVAIEPYPEPRLDGAAGATIVRRRVEEVDLEIFTALVAGDILFIDSSHVARFGGDVCREFLEILPRLAPGVWVHVHDIFLPHDYPAEWLLERRLAFNEQYLLEAFLAFNGDFEARAAAYWLCLEHPAEAARLWPGAPAEFQAGAHGCASFWMSRK